MKKQHELEDLKKQHELEDLKYWLLQLVLHLDREIKTSNKEKDKET